MRHGVKRVNAAIGTTLGAALIAAFAFSAPASAGQAAPVLRVAHPAHAAPAAADASARAVAHGENRPFLHVITSDARDPHGCCAAWAARMREAGFRVLVERRPPDILNRLKIASGITPRLAACHTARAEGYVIEGHVPGGDIHRLLEDRPEAVGLSAPGMPVGAPGMEDFGRSETYQTLLIRHDGAVRPWAIHIGR
ncbi:DUF411 domain-containing protein [Rhodovulum sp. DZ06]|uniref:DUF411 domain-containing protein n=1 Tax=Rhodovulum sp. DZ06 TaxID=3425126 RepID=UPI003D3324A7